MMVALVVVAAEQVETVEALQETLFVEVLVLLVKVIMVEVTKVLVKVMDQLLLAVAEALAE